MLKLETNFCDCGEAKYRAPNGKWKCRSCAAAKRKEKTRALRLKRDKARRKKKILPARKIPLEVRFWAKVDRRGKNECWNWLGNQLPHGHGTIGKGRRGEPMLLAHRVSMQLAGHDIERKLVLHKCNNSSCVNPKHLYVGTHKDNVRDSIEAGTFRLPPPREVQTTCPKCGGPKVLYVTPKQLRSMCRPCENARRRGKGYGRKSKVSLTDLAVSR